MPGDDFPPLPAAAEGAPTLALDVDVRNSSSPRRTSPSRQTKLARI